MLTIFTSSSKAGSLPGTRGEFSAAKACAQALRLNEEAVPAIVFLRNERRENLLWVISLPYLGWGTLLIVNF